MVLPDTKAELNTDARGQRAKQTVIGPSQKAANFGLEVTPSESFCGREPCCVHRGTKDASGCLGEMALPPFQGAPHLPLPRRPLWGPSLELLTTTIPQGEQPRPHLDPGMLQALGDGHSPSGKAPPPQPGLVTCAICTVLPPRSSKQGRVFQALPAPVLLSAARAGLAQTPVPEDLQPLSSPSSLAASP